jgi:hypothetical protein
MKDKYVRMNDVLALVQGDDACGPKPSRLRKEICALPSTKIERFFIVPESTLRELIENSNRYEALESGGVDNWPWCYESARDYLSFQKVKDFDELTELDLARFTEVK